MGGWGGVRDLTGPPPFGLIFPKQNKNRTGHDDVGNCVNKEGLTVNDG